MDPLLSRITVENGRPILRETNIDVSEVLKRFQETLSEDDVLASFPELQAGDVRACLAFAVHIISGMRIAPARND